jgi:hypothetical protein
MSFEYIRILNYIHIRKFEFIKLIDLKNAGWCGTPPISDKNYEGTWESIDGKLILNIGAVTKGFYRIYLFKWVQLSSRLL